jgi:broad specificity phosphatase PhoE
MELVFVRHAHATHNADAEIRGEVAYTDPKHIDAEITDKGLAQILKSREKPLGTFDAIYCSPSKRCRSTLLGMMPATNELPVELDDLLMEPQGFALSNRRAERASVLTSIPPTWNADGVAETNPFDILKEEYENGDTGLHTRVAEFTETSLFCPLKAASRRRVLVVTHHDWIKAWCHIYRSRDVSVGNCEAVTVKLV